MTTLAPPAQNDGKTYYRLAWATDVKDPHPFGERYQSRGAAQRKAPAVNRQRVANGLVPANYVLQLKFRSVNYWPWGRYIRGHLFPLPRTRIPKPPPIQSSPTR